MAAISASTVLREILTMQELKKKTKVVENVVLSAEKVLANKDTLLHIVKHYTLLYIVKCALGYTQPLHANHKQSSV